MDRSQPSLGGCQYQKPTPHHHTLFWPGVCSKGAQGRVNTGQLTMFRHVKEMAWPIHAAATAGMEISRSDMGVSDSSFLESRDVLGRQCDDEATLSPSRRRRCAGNDRRELGLSLYCFRHIFLGEKLMHALAHWVVIFSRWMVPRVCFLSGEAQRYSRKRSSEAARACIFRKSGPATAEGLVRAAAMSSSTESVGSRRTAHAACGSSFRHNVQAVGCN